MSVEPVNATHELDIVIVNWNSAPYLRKCLESVERQSSGVTYQVTIVDNASTEDDLDQLCQEFRSVHLIRNAVNAGFARANNIGARSTQAPYLLFLNPDTLVRGPALAELLSVLKKRMDAGIVGCRLLNSDLTLQVNCVQRYPTVLNQSLSSDFLYRSLPWLPLWGLAPLFNKSGMPQRVEVISGACLMIRRDVFEQVGQFSEEYFMYAEDVDLCHKTAKTGLSCYYLGSATVVHHGGGSSRLRPVSSWAAVVQCGAKLQFLRKTRGKAYGNLYRMAMSASAGVRWLLVTAAARYRTPSARKWAAILRWAFKPDAMLRKLTAAQER